MKDNDIIDHLENLLGNIPGVKEASKHPRLWEQCNEFPVIFINPAPAEIEQMYGNDYIVYLPIHISGLVSHHKDPGPEIQDLVNAILKELGSETFDYKDSTLVQGIETDSGTALPMGWCLITIQVTYSDTL